MVVFVIGFLLREYILMNDDQARAPAPAELDDAARTAAATEALQTMRQLASDLSTRRILPERWDPEYGEDTENGPEAPWAVDARPIRVPRRPSWADPPRAGPGLVGERRYDSVKTGPMGGLLLTLAAPPPEGPRENRPPAGVADVAAAAAAEVVDELQAALNGDPDWDGLMDGLDVAVEAVRAPRAGQNGWGAIDDPVAEGADFGAEGDFGDEGIWDDVAGVAEAIGMTGNPVFLARNVGLMYALVAFCLGLGMWVPMMFGRTFAIVDAVKILTLPLRAVRTVSDPVFDATLATALYLPRQAIAALAPIIGTKCTLLPPAIGKLCHSVFTSTTGVVGLAANSTDVASTLAGAERVLESNPRRAVGLKLAALFASVSKHYYGIATENDTLHRTLSVLLGYWAIFVGGMFYLATTQQAYSQNTFKVIRDGLIQQALFIKVAAFIFIEIVVFPTGCGAMLTLAASPLFSGVTIASAMGWYKFAPVSSFFLTWLAGTAFMFAFSMAVDSVRDSVRNGVMWFIRDPSSGDFHPVKEILERDSLVQLRKIGISALLYGGVIFATLGANTLLLRYGVGGGVLPLRWTQQRTFSFPLDLLIFRFVVPAAVRAAEPRRRIKELLVQTAKRTAHELRLSSFLFNVRDPAEEGSHVRRTWRAILTLKQSPKSEWAVNIKGRDVAFKKDGGWARVPGIDNVRVKPHRPMIVDVDDDGVPVTDDGMRVVAAQVVEQKTTRKKDAYTVVYLPPNYWLRVCVFVYLLWFVGSVGCVGAVVGPLLLGRGVFTQFTATEVHDVYALTVGLGVATGVTWAVRQAAGLPQLLKWGPYVVRAVIKARTRDIWQVITSTCVLGLCLPLLASTAFSALALLPLSPLTGADFASHVKQGLPFELRILPAWATGLTLVSAAYHVVSSPMIGIANPWRQAIVQSEADWAEGRKVHALVRLRTLVFPAVIQLAVAVILPALGAWAKTAMGGGGEAELLEALRFGYGCLARAAVLVTAGGMVGKRMGGWVDALKEREYLVERRLRRYDGSARAAEGQGPLAGGGYVQAQEPQPGAQGGAEGTVEWWARDQVIEDGRGLFGGDREEERGWWEGEGEGEGGRVVEEPREEAWQGMYQ